MARPFVPDSAFWLNVVISPFDEACWLWKGWVGKNGRGYCRFRGRSNVLAHRAAYELEYGKIPDGMSVLHSCDVPLCCNPRHLKIGTQADNLADMRSKGRGYDFPVLYGEAAPSVKLTDANVAKIRELYATGRYSQTRLAAMFCVGQTQVSRIIRRERR